MCYISDNNHHYDLCSKLVYQAINLKRKFFCSEKYSPKSGWSYSKVDLNIWIIGLSVDVLCSQIDKNCLEYYLSYMEVVAYTQYNFLHKKQPIWSICELNNYRNAEKSLIENLSISWKNSFFQRCDDFIYNIITIKAAIW